jgi:hypothetical protein
MLFLLQQYQEVILTLLKKLFKKNLFIFNGIFHPSGEPILLGGWGGCFVAVHLRYTCTAAWTDASHLQQAWLVNNPGQLMKDKTESSGFTFWRQRWQKKK